MDQQQWARVKELFHATLSQDERERREYLDAATVDEPLIRAEVERLLEADRDASGFIEEPAVDALLTGSVIGHYAVGRLLGTGGMGRVYAARDLELGRDVALKIAAIESEEAQTRLRREAQHASRLSHPHICHIYEVGRADGRVFIVMELVPGRALADLLREGPLPVRDARRYGLEVADALAHAHEQGVLHRDLKSTNVVVTPKRGAKVLDFGLARILDTHRLDVLSQSQRSLTADGMMAGTLSYMPPELLRGQRGDQRADIWALGVLLYEMVAAQRPFTGATGFELSAAILHEPPAALPEAVPASMRAVIERCLAKDPANRFQDAGDVHRALEAIVPEEDQHPAPARPRSMSRRSMALAATIGLLIIVAVTLGLVAWWGRETGTFSNARGYSLLGDGRVDEAVEEFRGVTRRNPNDANAWDSLGEGYLASGQPDRALDAYTHALAIESNFTPSMLGRSVALGALGRYDEALMKPPSDVVEHAWLLSRVGRYIEAEELLSDKSDESPDGDRDAKAATRLAAAWLLIEQTQYARALTEIQAVEALFGLEANPKKSIMALGDLLAVIAEARAGRVQDAADRQSQLKAHADADDPAEARWLAAADGEIALAQRSFARAGSSFASAQAPAWTPLGRSPLAFLATSAATRDAQARVMLARGDRAAAVEEYRRLTTAGAARRSSALLEPRDVLALARLLDAQVDTAGARAAYQRFLDLWEGADDNLPELAEARRALARLPVS